MLSFARSPGRGLRGCLACVGFLILPGGALAQDSNPARHAAGVGAVLPFAAQLPSVMSEPGSASELPAPLEEGAAADGSAGESQSLPVGAWTELTAGCRRLTDWQSSSEGCGAGIRRGRYAYFHAGVGFFTTPRFERYVRYAAPASPSTSDGAKTTIIDPARPTIYYLELGPGVAIWPTRQINVHIEAGGLTGAAVSRASLVLPTSDTTSFVLGFFAGIGVSYRVPSRPWAVGFDYRIQGVPYGGLSSGEEVVEPGVEVGHQLFGFAHSFGLSISARFEDDRDD
jgi:hypothetical protein